MYICVCKAVRERDIHEAVRNGASSMKQLSRELGVGTECGLCVGCAKECLQDARQEQKSPLTVNHSMTLKQAFA